MGEISSIADIAGSAINVITGARKMSRVALTSYTKQANVMSRLYIEDSILRDDICVPLVGTLNQLYVSYILSALNLDTQCANGRTVREMFELVATENYDIIGEIMNNFGKINQQYSNEETVVRLEPDTQRLPVGRVIELTMTGINVLSETEATTSRLANGDKDPSTWSLQRSQTKDKDKDGKDVMVDMVDDNGKPVSRATVKEKKKPDTYQFKAYLYVQLIPYVLTPDVVTGYIGANFVPPTSKRWTQFKAGEISFWKDFILARDVIRRQRNILKQDKNGVIMDMMAKQRSSLYHWWEGALNLFGAHMLAKSGSNVRMSDLGIRSQSHNLANTILITSKATFDRACREVGLNFANNTLRQKFFNKTWSMIVCVVDPLYNTVDMYFNGVDMKGTYNFNMINKVGAKGQDNFDLKEVMSAFSQGLTPKF